MRGLECGVIIVSADHRVVDVNPAAEILLGSSRELIVGISWTELVKRHDLDSEKRYRVRALASADKGGERVVLIEDLLGGGVRGAIQSDFVASVSHEMRTPMAIIHEGMSQIREGLLGEINEDQKKFLDMSLASAQRLDKILRALLDVSIIQSGRLTLKKSIFSIEEVAREAAVFFKQAVTLKGLALGLDLPAKSSTEGTTAFYGDRDQLLKAVVHLIDNAIKYTPSGDIRCGVETHGSTARVWVADRGTGLSPEERIKIFEKFSQFGRVAGSGAKGLGLGLAVVKGITEAHGGSVSADQRPDGGSIFSIYLPHAGELPSYRLALTESITRAAAEEVQVTAAVCGADAAEGNTAAAKRIRQEFRRMLKSSEHQVAVLRGRAAVILFGINRPRAAALLGEIFASLRSEGVRVADERIKFCEMPLDAASADEMMRLLGLSQDKEN